MIIEQQVPVSSTSFAPVTEAQLEEVVQRIVEEAREAVAAVRIMRRFVRHKLGLPE